MNDTEMADLKAGDALTCSVCGAVVGELVDVNGRLWLCVEKVELDYGHGRCRACKRVWHFDAGSIRLARLIRLAGRDTITVTE